jgi:hypothetical protein
VAAAARITAKRIVAGNIVLEIRSQDLGPGF